MSFRRGERKAECTNCGETREIVYGWKTSHALCLGCNISRLRTKAKDKPKRRMSEKAVASTRARIMTFNEFAEQLWAERKHECEECGKKLESLKGMYISHIVGRDLSRRQYYNPDNVNILCTDCHREWEYGDRRAMKIWETNSRVIERLRRDGY